MTTASPEIRSSVFIAKLALMAVIATVGVSLALSQRFGVAIIGMVLIGSMMAHAVELQHQCVHYAAFKQKKFNRVFGMLLGVPMMVSFFRYRRDHLVHHRRLGTAQDRAFFSYAISGNLTWKAVAFDLFGIRHLIAVLQEFRTAARHTIFNPSSINRETVGVLICGTLLLVAIVASIQFQADIIVRLWILPLLFVAQPIHFLVDLPEHLSCSPSSRDVLQNTRTIVGSKFSRWFTNGNNFHVEHHLFPMAPFESLGEISRALAGRHSHLSKSYPDFYRDVLSRLIANPSESRLPGTREVTS